MYLAATAQKSRRDPTPASSLCGSGHRDRAHYDVREGHQAGLLQGFPRSDVIHIATRGWDSPHSIGDSLELLHEVGAQPSSPILLGDFDVYVAIGGL